MAIYRLSATVVKRSEGRTVTAAAAYRAGAVITDTRTGQVFDYARRRGVLHAEILAPDDAPAWIRDRAELWNATEAAEKRKDAQLAREVQVALPCELALAQQTDLVRAFVTAAFVARGMVADVAIHAADRHGDGRNTHAHILLTMRELAGGGFGKKVRSWNDSGLLEQWRVAWAEFVNRALERERIPVRVDHRSLAAQGITRTPQIHIGTAVAEMAARGITTDRGERAATIEATALPAQTPIPEVRPVGEVQKQKPAEGRPRRRWHGLLDAFRAAAAAFVRPLRPITAGGRRYLTRAYGIG
jgi:ATP-dependent exoDNAse (exonuclease V) alpha subunit